MDKEIIILFFILSITFFIIGYYLGEANSIRWCADVGFRILNKSGTDFGSVGEQVKGLIFQYQNKIGSAIK